MLTISTGGISVNIDSARANLAGTFVNAFVNAGFGNDKLMVKAEESNSWVYKNKDHGIHNCLIFLSCCLPSWHRHDECCGVPWSQFTVGDRGWDQPRRQVYLLQ